MTIGKTFTKSGSPRITLAWYATQRATGQQYAKRTLKLPESQYRELFAKIIELAPADTLRAALQRIEGR
jgi:hypothetical protein